MAANRELNSPQLRHVLLSDVIPTGTFPEEVRSRFFHSRAEMALIVGGKAGGMPLRLGFRSEDQDRLERPLLIRSERAAPLAALR